MDPIAVSAIVGALGPLALDAFRALKDRFLPNDGYRPQSMAEWTEMRKVMLDEYRAVQGDSAPSGVPWVDAAIKLQKPALATIVLAVWGWQALTLAAGPSDNVTNFAAMVGFYMFGDYGRMAFQSARAPRWRSERVD